MQHTQSLLLHIYPIQTNWIKIAFLPLDFAHSAQSLSSYHLAMQYPQKNILRIQRYHPAPSDGGNTAIHLPSHSRQSRKRASSSTEPTHTIHTRYPRRSSTHAPHQPHFTCKLLPQSQHQHLAAASSFHIFAQKFVHRRQFHNTELIFIILRPGPE